jgi:hypothetical protein
VTADPHAESVPTAQASPVSRSLQHPRETDRRLVNRDEHDLLTFAIQWIPFDGGPADEIFIRFGMTPERFRERLHEVIRCHWCRIHPVTRRHLIRVWLSHLTADAWGDQRDD